MPSPAGGQQARPGGPRWRRPSDRGAHVGAAMGKNGDMPRAIWSGSVSFGLVNVPVKLVTATSPKDVRFHQLHDADDGRIQQKRVCSVDGEEVAFDHIVKGYDLGGGRYVVVEPEELAALDVAATRTIDIEEFVDLADIDPVYFERSYYLVPDGRAEKPYALLVETMARTGQGGGGPVRAAHQAVPGHPAGPGRGAGAGHHALRRRGDRRRRSRGADGGRHRAERAGGDDGDAAGGVVVGAVRPVQVHRRLPGEGPGPDRGQGRR